MKCGKRISHVSLMTELVVK